MKTFSVIIEWDEEASVWYVSESDVPGLMTEAATHEEMQRKLSILIPELVELNAHKIGFTPGSNFPSSFKPRSWSISARGTDGGFFTPAEEDA